MSNDGKRITLVASIFLFVLLIVQSDFAFCDVSKSMPSTIQEKQEKYQNDKADSTIKSIERHEKYEDKLLSYRSFELEHRESSFWAQYWVGWMIFFCVMLLVLGGLYLAYQQFKLDEKSGNATESSFEISKSGLKIRSSVIGLIVLSMSFAVFYLYVKEVYKIKELPPISQIENKNSSIQK